VRIGKRLIKCSKAESGNCELDLRRKRKVRRLMAKVFWIAAEMKGTTER
jgi:hypothetical protein